MRTIFLADAHLRNPQDVNYQKLISFLEEQQQLDGLVLLGDIFEFWLGYRHLTFTAYIPLLEKLRQLSANGTQLFFVEGNHDFNLGPYFSDTLNCRIIKDQQLIEWDGRKLLLCHGDLLNPNKNYQRLRSFWRSGLIRVLAKIVHPDFVWSFALWLSDKSQKNKPGFCHWNPSPLLQTYAENISTAGAEVIFCGHFHQPITTSHAEKEIIAVGDWISQFSYAEMIDGHIELKSYSV